ncbi:MAG: helix-turn-helix domain-containing protein, partial [Candidatus Omnitrophota bacterium]
MPSSPWALQNIALKRADLAPHAVSALEQALIKGNTGALWALQNIALKRADLAPQAVKALGKGMDKGSTTSFEAMTRIAQEKPDLEEELPFETQKAFLWGKNKLPVAYGIYQQYKDQDSPKAFIEELIRASRETIASPFDFNNEEDVLSAFIGIRTEGITDVDFDEFKERLGKLKAFEQVHPGYWANLFKKSDYPVIRLASQGNPLDISQVDEDVLAFHRNQLSEIQSHMNDLSLPKELLGQDYGDFIQRTYAYVQIRKENPKTPINSKLLKQHIKYKLKDKTVSDIEKDITQLKDRTLINQAMFAVARSMSQNFSAQNAQPYRKLARDIILANEFSDDWARHMADDDPLTKIETFNSFYEDAKHHLPLSLGLSLDQIPKLKGEFEIFTKDLFNEISKAVITKEQSTDGYTLTPAGFLGVFRGRAGIIDCSFDVDDKSVVDGKGDAYTRALHEDTRYYLVKKGSSLKGYVGLQEAQDDQGRKILAIDTINSPSLNSSELIQELLGKLQGVALTKGFEGIALPKDLDASFNFDNDEIVKALPEYRKASSVTLRPIHQESWNKLTGMFGKDKYNSMEQGAFKLVKNIARPGANQPVATVRADQASLTRADQASLKEDISRVEKIARDALLESLYLSGFQLRTNKERGRLKRFFGNPGHSIRISRMYPEKEGRLQRSRSGLSGRIEYIVDSIKGIENNPQILLDMEDGRTRVTAASDHSLAGDYAFAPPKGTITIPLFAARLMSDGDITAIVGHEFNHLAKRHAGYKSISDVVEVDAGNQPERQLEIFGLSSRWVRSIRQMARDFLDRGFTPEEIKEFISQGKELEADLDGLKLAFRLGFDPSQVASEYLKASRIAYEKAKSDGTLKKSRRTVSYQTHPGDGVRRAFLEQKALELKALGGEYAGDIIKRTNLWASILADWASLTESVQPSAASSQPDVASLSSVNGSAVIASSMPIVAGTADVMVHAIKDGGHAVRVTRGDPFTDAGTIKLLEQGASVIALTEKAGRGIAQRLALEGGQVVARDEIDLSKMESLEKLEEANVIFVGNHKTVRDLAHLPAIGNDVTGQVVRQLLISSIIENIDSIKVAKSKIKPQAPPQNEQTVKTSQRPADDPTISIRNDSASLTRDIYRELRSQIGDDVEVDEKDWRANNARRYEHYIARRLGWKDSIGTFRETLDDFGWSFKELISPKQRHITDSLIRSLRDSNLRDVKGSAFEYKPGQIAAIYVAAKALIEKDPTVVAKAIGTGKTNIAMAAIHITFDVIDRVWWRRLARQIPGPISKWLQKRNVIEIHLLDKLKSQFLVDHFGQYLQNDPDVDVRVLGAPEDPFGDAADAVKKGGHAFMQVRDQSLMEEQAIRALKKGVSVIGISMAGEKGIAQELSLQNDQVVVVDEIDLSQQESAQRRLIEKDKVVYIISEETLQDLADIPATPDNQTANVIRSLVQSSIKMDNEKHQYIPLDVYKPLWNSEKGKNGEYDFVKINDEELANNQHAKFEVRLVDEKAVAHRDRAKKHKGKFNKFKFAFHEDPKRIRNAVIDDPQALMNQPSSVIAKGQSYQEQLADIKRLVKEEQIDEEAAKQWLDSIPQFVENIYDYLNRAREQGIRDPKDGKLKKVKITWAWSNIMKAQNPFVRMIKLSDKDTEDVVDQLYELAKNENAEYLQEQAEAIRGSYLQEHAGEPDVEARAQEKAGKWLEGKKGLRWKFIENFIREDERYNKSFRRLSGLKAFKLFVNAWAQTTGMELGKHFYSKYLSSEPERFRDVNYNVTGSWGQQNAGTHYGDPLVSAMLAVKSVRSAQEKIASDMGGWENLQTKEAQEEFEKKVHELIPNQAQDVFNALTSKDVMDISYSDAISGKGFIPGDRIVALTGTPDRDKAAYQKIFGKKKPIVVIDKNRFLNLDNSEWVVVKTLEEARERVAQFIDKETQADYILLNVRGSEDVEALSGEIKGKKVFMITGKIEDEKRAQDVLNGFKDQVREAREGAVFITQGDPTGSNMFRKVLSNNSAKKANVVHIDIDGITTLTQHKGRVMGPERLNPAEGEKYFTVVYLDDPSLSGDNRNALRAILEDQTLSDEKPDDGGRTEREELLAQKALKIAYQLDAWEALKTRQLAQSKTTVSLTWSENFKFRKMFYDQALFGTPKLTRHTRGNLGVLENLLGERWVERHEKGNLTFLNFIPYASVHAFALNILGKLFGQKWVNKIKRNSLDVLNHLARYPLVRSLAVQENSRGEPKKIAKDVLDQHNGTATLHRANIERVAYEKQNEARGRFFFNQAKKLQNYLNDNSDRESFTWGEIRALVNEKTALRLAPYLDYPVDQFIADMDRVFLKENKSKDRKQEYKKLYQSRKNRDLFVQLAAGQDQLTEEEARTLAKVVHSLLLSNGDDALNLSMDQVLKAYSSDANFNGISALAREHEDFVEQKGKEKNLDDYFTNNIKEGIFNEVGHGQISVKEALDKLSADNLSSKLEETKREIGSDHVIILGYLNPLQWSQGISPAARQIHQFILQKALDQMPPRLQRAFLGRPIHVVETLSEETLDESVYLKAEWLEGSSLGAQTELAKVGLAASSVSHQTTLGRVIGRVIYAISENIRGKNLHIGAGAGKDEINQIARLVGAINDTEDDPEKWDDSVFTLAAKIVREANEIPEIENEDPEAKDVRLIQQKDEAIKVFTGLRENKQEWEENREKARRQYARRFEEPAKPSFKEATKVLFAGDGKPKPKEENSMIKELFNHWFPFDKDERHMNFGKVKVLAKPSSVTLLSIAGVLIGTVIGGHGFPFINPEALAVLPDDGAILSGLKLLAIALTGPMVRVAVGAVMIIAQIRFEDAKTRLGHIGNFAVGKSAILYPLFAAYLSSLSGNYNVTETPGLNYLFAYGVIMSGYLSVVVHEIVHGLQAALFGIRSTGIKLHAFGGANSLESMGKTRFQQVMVAVVGPLTNLVLAIGAALIAQHFINPQTSPILAKFIGHADGNFLDILWENLKGFTQIGNLNFIKFQLYITVTNLILTPVLDAGRMFKAMVFKGRYDEIAATRKTVKWGGLLGVLEFSALAYFTGIWYLPLFGVVLAVMGRNELLNIGKRFGRKAPKNDSSMHADLIPGASVVADYFKSILSAKGKTGAASQTAEGVVADKRNAEKALQGAVPVFPINIPTPKKGSGLPLPSSPFGLPTPMGTGLPLPIPISKGPAPGSGTFGGQPDHHIMEFARSGASPADMLAILAPEDSRQGHKADVKAKLAESGSGNTSSGGIHDNTTLAAGRFPSVPGSANGISGEPITTAVSYARSAPVGIGTDNSTSSQGVNSANDVRSSLTGSSSERKAETGGARGVRPRNGRNTHSFAELSATGLTDIQNATDLGGKYGYDRSLYRGITGNSAISIVLADASSMKAISEPVMVRELAGYRAQAALDRQAETQGLELRQLLQTLGIRPAIRFDADASLYAENGSLPVVPGVRQEVLTGNTAFEVTPAIIREVTSGLSAVASEFFRSGDAEAAAASDNEPVSQQAISYPTGHGLDIQPTKETRTFGKTPNTPRRSSLAYRALPLIILGIILVAVLVIIPYDYNFFYTPLFAGASAALLPVVGMITSTNEVSHPSNTVFVKVIERRYKNINFSQLIRLLFLAAMIHQCLVATVISSAVHSPEYFIISGVVLLLATLAFIINGLIVGIRGKDVTLPILLTVDGRFYWTSPYLKSDMKKVLIVPAIAFTQVIFPIGTQVIFPIGSIPGSSPHSLLTGKLYSVLKRILPFIIVIVVIAVLLNNPSLVLDNLAAASLTPMLGMLKVREDGHAYESLHELFYGNMSTVHEFESMLNTYQAFGLEAGFGMDEFGRLTNPVSIGRRTGVKVRNYLFNAKHVHIHPEADRSISIPDCYGKDGNRRGLTNEAIIVWGAGREFYLSVINLLKLPRSIYAENENGKEIFDHAGELKEDVLYERGILEFYRVNEDYALQKISREEVRRIENDLRLKSHWDRKRALKNWGTLIQKYLGDESKMFESAIIHRTILKILTVNSGYDYDQLVEIFFGTKAYNTYIYHEDVSFIRDILETLNDQFLAAGKTKSARSTRELILRINRKMNYLIPYNGQNGQKDGITLYSFPAIDPRAVKDLFQSVVSHIRTIRGLAKGRNPSVATVDGQTLPADRQASDDPFAKAFEDLPTDRVFIVSDGLARILSLDESANAGTVGQYSSEMSSGLKKALKREEVEPEAISQLLAPGAIFVSDAYEGTKQRKELAHEFFHRIYRNGPQSLRDAFNVAWNSIPAELRQKVMAEFYRNRYGESFEGHYSEENRPEEFWANFMAAMIQAKDSGRGSTPTLSKVIANDNVVQVLFREGFARRFEEKLDALEITPVEVTFESDLPVYDGRIQYLGGWINDIFGILAIAIGVIALIKLVETLTPHVFRATGHSRRERTETRPQRTEKTYLRHLRFESVLSAVTRGGMPWNDKQNTNRSSSTTRSNSSRTTASSRRAKNRQEKPDSFSFLTTMEISIPVTAGRIPGSSLKPVTLTPSARRQVPPTSNATARAVTSSKSKVFTLITAAILAFFAATPLQAAEAGFIETDKYFLIKFISYFLLVPLVGGLALVIHETGHFTPSKIFGYRPKFNFGGEDAEVIHKPSAGHSFHGWKWIIVCAGGMLMNLTMGAIGYIIFFQQNVVLLGDYLTNIFKLFTLINLAMAACFFISFSEDSDIALVIEAIKNTFKQNKIKKNALSSRINAKPAQPAQAEETLSANIFTPLNIAIAGFVVVLAAIMTYRFFKNRANSANKQFPLGRATAAYQIFRALFDNAAQDIFNVMIASPCQYKCAECIARPAIKEIEDANEPLYVDAQHLRNLFDELAGSNKVQIVGLGEPTTYGKRDIYTEGVSQDFLDIIRYAAERIKEVRIYTNAYVVPEDFELAKVFFAQFPKNVVWVVSVDKDHKAQMKLRTGKSLRNIIKIMEQLHAKGLVQVNYHVTRDLTDVKNRKLLRRFGLFFVSSKRIRMETKIGLGAAIDHEDARDFENEKLQRHIETPKKIYPYIGMNGSLLTSVHVAFMPRQQRYDTGIISSLFDETTSPIAYRSAIIGNTHEKPLSGLILNNLIFSRNYDKIFRKTALGPDAIRNILRSLNEYLFGDKEQALAMFAQVKKEAARWDDVFDPRTIYNKTFELRSIMGKLYAYPPFRDFIRKSFTTSPKTTLYDRFIITKVIPIRSSKIIVKIVDEKMVFTRVMAFMIGLFLTYVYCTFDCDMQTACVRYTAISALVIFGWILKDFLESVNIDLNGRYEYHNNSKLFYFLSGNWFNIRNARKVSKYIVREFKKEFGEELKNVKFFRFLASVWLNVQNAKNAIRKAFKKITTSIQKENRNTLQPSLPEEPPQPAQAEETLSANIFTPEAVAAIGLVLTLAGIMIAHNFFKNRRNSTQRGMRIATPSQGPPVKARISPALAILALSAVPAFIILFAVFPEHSLAFMPVALSDIALPGLMGAIKREKTVQEESEKLPKQLLLILPKVSINERIYLLKDHRKMSVSQLAKASGLYERVIHDYISVAYKFNISTRNLIKLARGLRVEPSLILVGLTFKKAIKGLALAKRINLCMVISGYGIGRLAKKVIHVQFETLKSWITGQETPKTDQIIKLARAFGIEPLLLCTDLSFEEAIKKKSSSVGEDIQLLRLEKNMLSKEFIKGRGFSANSLYSWESGYSIPSAKFLRKMSAATGIEASLLMTHFSAENLMRQHKRTGERIGELLKIRSISPEELAGKMDVSIEEVNVWINQESIPTPEQIIAMGKIFEVNALSIYTYLTFEEVLVRNRTLADRIIVYRIFKGIDRHAWLDLAGIAVETLDDWEQDRAIPDFASIEVLARTFGITPVDLLKGWPLLNTLKRKEQAADRVILARLSKDLSRKELAKKSGLRVERIIAIEENKNKPSTSDLQAIAKVCPVSFADFINGLALEQIDQARETKNKGYAELPEGLLKALLKMSVKGRLWYLRNYRKMSIADLSKASGVSEKRINDYENEKNGKGLLPRTIVKLAHGLRVEPSLIFIGRPIKEALKGLSLGERIDLCREISGSSQGVLVHSLHLTPLIFRKWINNQRTPTTDEIIKLARFFGMEPLLLWTDLTFEEALCESSSFGENIQLLRLEENMLLDEFSKKTGISQNAIRLWEKNVSRIDSKNLKKLSDIFGHEESLIYASLPLEKALRRRKIMAERIELLMKVRDITIGELETEMGSDQKTIRQWLRQKSKPGLDKIIRMSKIFKVNALWIYTHLTFEEILKESENLADRIIILRMDRGINKKELAQQIEVDITTIGAWETGKIGPQISHIHALARAFGAETSALLKGKPLKNIIRRKRSLADRVQLARLSKDLSRKELAKKSGLRVERIIAIEENTIKPSTGDLQAIAKVCPVSFEELIEGLELWGVDGKKSRTAGVYTLMPDLFGIFAVVVIAIVLNKLFKTLTQNVFRATGHFRRERTAARGEPRSPRSTRVEAGQRRETSKQKPDSLRTTYEMRFSSLSRQSGRLAGRQQGIRAKEGHKTMKGAIDLARNLLSFESLSLISLAILIAFNSPVALIAVLALFAFNSLGLSVNLFNNIYEKNKGGTPWTRETVEPLMIPLSLITRSNSSRTTASLRRAKNRQEKPGSFLSLTTMATFIRAMARKILGNSLTPATLASLESVPAPPISNVTARAGFASVSPTGERRWRQPRRPVTSSRSRLALTQPQKSSQSASADKTLSANIFTPLNIGIAVFALIFIISWIVISKESEKIRAELMKESDYIRGILPFDLEPVGIKLDFGSLISNPLLEKRQISLTTFPSLKYKTFIHELMHFVYCDQMKVDEQACRGVISLMWEKKAAIPMIVIKIASALLWVLAFGISYLLINLFIAKGIPDLPMWFGLSDLTIGRVTAIVFVGLVVLKQVLWFKQEAYRFFKISIEENPNSNSAEVWRRTSDEKDDYLRENSMASPDEFAADALTWYLFEPEEFRERAGNNENIRELYQRIKTGFFKDVEYTIDPSSESLLKIVVLRKNSALPMDRDSDLSTKRDGSDPSTQTDQDSQTLLASTGILTPEAVAAIGLVLTLAGIMIAHSFFKNRRNSTQRGMRIATPSQGPPVKARISPALAILALSAVPAFIILFAVFPEHSLAFMPVALSDIALPGLMGVIRITSANKNKISDFYNQPGAFPRIKTFNITDLLGEALKHGKIKQSFPLPNGKTWGKYESMQVGVGLSKIMCEIEMRNATDATFTFTSYKKDAKGHDEEHKKSRWLWTGEGTPQYQPEETVESKIISEISDFYNQPGAFPRTKTFNITDLLGPKALKHGAIKRSFPLPTKGKTWGKNEGMRVAVGLYKVTCEIHMESPTQVTFTFTSYKKGKDKKHKKRRWLWTGEDTPQYQPEKDEKQKQEQEKAIRDKIIAFYRRTYFPRTKTFNITDFLGEALKYGIIQSTFPLPTNGKTWGRQESSMQVGQGLSKVMCEIEMRSATDATFTFTSYKKDAKEHDEEHKESRFLWTGEGTPQYQPEEDEELRRQKKEAIKNEIIAFYRRTDFSRTKTFNITDFL